MTIRGWLLLAALPCVGCDRSSVDVKQVSADEARALPPSPVPEPATVEEAARAAQRTHEVTRALMAETTLDATHVDVLTHEAGKAVVLRGVVPSTLQRDLAERLAREQAPGYSVRNELAVGP